MFGDVHLILVWFGPLRQRQEAAEVRELQETR